MSKYKKGDWVIWDGMNYEYEGFSQGGSFSTISNDGSENPLLVRTSELSPFNPSTFTLNAAINAIQALQDHDSKKALEKDGAAALEYQASAAAYANCVAILSGVEK